MPTTGKTTDEMLAALVTKRLGTAVGAEFRKQLGIPASPSHIPHAQETALEQAARIAQKGAAE